MEVGFDTVAADFQGVYRIRMEEVQEKRAFQLCRQEDLDP